MIGNNERLEELAEAYLGVFDLEEILELSDLTDVEALTRLISIGLIPLDLLDSNGLSQTEV